MENYINIYFQKYIKYKKKYYTTKKELEQNNKFYIVHGTNSLINMLKIIDSGYIKSSSELTSTYKGLGENKSSKFIYGNIYFDEFIENKYSSTSYKDDYMNYSIILHPNILDEFPIFVNKKWNGDIFTQIATNDKLIEKEIKIKNIFEYIKERLQDDCKEYNKTHEILFSSKIPIKKYILAVTCNECENKFPEKLVQIKKYLKRNGLNHVKILSSNKPVNNDFLYKKD